MSSLFCYICSWVCHRPCIGICSFSIQFLHFCPKNKKYWWTYLILVWSIARNVTSIDTIVSVAVQCACELSILRQSATQQVRVWIAHKNRARKRASARVLKVCSQIWQKWRSGHAYENGAHRWTSVSMWCLSEAIQNEEGRSQSSTNSARTTEIWVHSVFETFHYSAQYAQSPEHATCFYYQRWWWCVKFKKIQFRML